MLNKMPEGAEGSCAPLTCSCPNYTSDSPLFTKVSRALGIYTTHEVSHKVCFHVKVGPGGIGDSVRGGASGKLSLIASST